MKNRMKFLIVIVSIIVAVAMIIVQFLPDSSIISTIVGKKHNSLSNLETQVKTTAKNRIHFIGTGSSDAILIESEGHFGLIDSSNPEDGIQGIKYNNVLVVKDYIENVIGENGRLDYIIATHSHSDHIGGMPEIANSYFVDNNTTYFYKPYIGSIEDTKYPDWDNKGYFEKAISAMKSKNVKMIDISIDQNGEERKFEESIKLDKNLTGKADITLYNLSRGEKNDEENARSIITYIQLNNKKILLTGDAVDSGKNRYTQENVAKQVGKIDILKIAHHGNENNTNFRTLDLINPDYLIFTSGGLGKTLNVFVPQFAHFEEKEKETKKYITGTLGEYINSEDAKRINATSSALVIDLEKNSNVNVERMYVSKTASILVPEKELQHKGLEIYNDKGWVNFAGEYVYVKDGKFLKGWQEISWNTKKYTFYFDENGIMAKGLKEIEGKQYFFNESGDLDNTKIAPENIKLNKRTSNLDLNGNNTDKLVATIVPTNANIYTGITWLSSNEKIVNVNETGQITAKAKGNATIIAKTENGKTAVCEITVVNTAEKNKPSTNLDDNKTNRLNDIDGTLAPHKLPRAGSEGILCIIATVAAIFAIISFIKWKKT